MDKQIDNYIYSYYDRQYTDIIDKAKSKITIKRNIYSKNESEKLKAKLIEELSKINIKDFNANINYAKMGYIINVTYDNFEYKDLYDELFSTETQRKLLSIRDFIIQKTIVQENIYPFRNVEEIEKFIDTCIKGTYVEILIKKISPIIER